MFRRKATSHGAVSTNGFEVTFYGRDELIYRERLPGREHRQITVFAELLLGIGRAIAAGAGFPKCWEPPYQSTSISAEERKQILRRITDALDFLGIAYVLDGVDSFNERWCPSHYKRRDDPG